MWLWTRQETAWVVGTMISGDLTRRCTVHHGTLRQMFAQKKKLMRSESHLNQQVTVGLHDKKKAPGSEEILQLQRINYGFWGNRYSWSAVPLNKKQAFLPSIFSPQCWDSSSAMEWGMLFNPLRAEKRAFLCFPCLFLPWPLTFTLKRLKIESIPQQLERTWSDAPEQHQSADSRLWNSLGSVVIQAERNFCYSTFFRPACFHYFLFRKKSFCRLTLYMLNCAYCIGIYIVMKYIKLCKFSTWHVLWQRWPILLNKGCICGFSL